MTQIFLGGSWGGVGVGSPKTKATLHQYFHLLVVIPLYFILFTNIVLNNNFIFIYVVKA